MAFIEPGSAAAERLASTPLAWLTTVRRDGQPQSSYVWFHFDGTDILVASQPGTAKLRNIRGNPKVSLHLDGDGEGGGVL
ncbi:MAG TPA: pyridoxamine 5'-phosphate oxidase family protein, partial [Acidimicrobiales bacterium]|nr:pyridoxamine 5'-phosphate oxidase family protein [Acidimicrobiales bacterium]